ncbi:integrase, catalytic region, zinc finger, CCHC-type containing protein [Tanacetum coccineum]
MLYDEFDKFTFEPGESIHLYYLRYAKLINDLNMIPMSMSNMQINTKFVNHLQLEWSRFVTAAKQARDLHVVNFDQLYAFLKHNDKDAIEVCKMRQRFPNPLALLANTYNPPLSYSNRNIQYHYQPPEVYQLYQFYQSTTPITQQLIQSPPKQSYEPPVALKQSPILPTQPDFRFAIPTFLPTDDQIEITVQNVQRRQSQGYAGNAGKSQAIGARVINTVGDAGANQPRVIRCYNCRGEGHIAKQCTKKKRVNDFEWFKGKTLLTQAQEARVKLHKEQQNFLADRLEENDDCDDLQLHTTINFKADHVDAYDSNCDDQATANAILMASLSSAGSLNDDTVTPTYDSNTL